MQKLTPIKAIRKHCLDCCCNSSNEVKLCQVESCALHPFRFGENPYRKKRELTEEQMEMRKRIVAAARLCREQEKNKNTPTEGKDTTGDINLPEQAV